MPYITPNEAFQGYAHAIIVGVYTDAITASAVKKENNAIVVVSSATEPMSGVAGDMLPVDNVLFNIEKAVMALPAETRGKGTPVIIVVGPGTGTCEYLTIAKTRDTRERKITAEEMNEIIASGNTEKGNERVIKNHADYFSIDGFSVPDPIGMNGSEVSVGVTRLSCASAFENECNAKLSAFGFHYGGLIDMRYAAMRAARFYERSAHALLLFLFEHETNVVIARENAVRAVGVSDGGYGILYAHVAEAFSVGNEEAKEIVRAYRKQELDENAKAAVEQAMSAAGKEAVEKAREAITKTDSANIIPGNVHVVSAQAFPEIVSQFLSGEWMKELPMERNATINVFSDAECKGFATPFDRMSADFLLRHFK